jgi:phosphoribosylamine-glycine ligase
MEFIIATADYSGLGLAVRLIQEGHSAVLAVQPGSPEIGASQAFQAIGKNLIEKRPLADLLAWRSEYQNCYWIWDGNHSVRENELLRSEGFRVFGGGLFADLMEHDRDFAVHYCAQYGLFAPETRRFTDPRQAVAFLKRRRTTAFVLKPDRGSSAETWVPEDSDPEAANQSLRERLQSAELTTPFILQARKRGTEANIEVWFVNGEPRFALALLECKRFGDGDTGEMTGCSLDFVFPISLQARAVRETVGKLFPAYRRMRYTGFGDANVIIDDDGFWLLEKCERFGYNCHPNLLWSVCRDEAGQTLASLVDGTLQPNFSEAYGASVTVHNPGNTPAQKLSIPNDILDSIYFWDVYREDGDWHIAGFETAVLMISASGSTASGAWTRVMENARRVHSPGVTYRTDGGSTGFANSPLKRLATLQEMELLS